MVISSMVSVEQLAGCVFCVGLRGGYVWSSGSTEAGPKERAMTETPNERAGGEGGIPSWFHVRRSVTAAPHREC